MRLGDGTEESHARMQAALDAEWPWLAELFEPADAGLVEAGVAVDPPTLRDAVLARVEAVVAEATLHVPQVDAARRWRSPGPAHRGARPPARRHAAPAPLAPGSLVVTAPRAWDVAATVPDPEIPVVTIADLGILRDVTEDDRGRVHVQITPTYSGCPAMETIRDDLVDALTLAGYSQVGVELVLSPAWTTDWLTDEARAKLEEYGVAPPAAHVGTDGPVR